MYWQTQCTGKRSVCHHAGNSPATLLYSVSQKRPEPLRRQLCVAHRVECRLRHSPACSRPVDSELLGNGQPHFCTLRHAWRGDSGSATWSRDNSPIRRSAQRSAQTLPARFGQLTTVSVFCQRSDNRNESGQTQILAGKLRPLFVVTLRIIAVRLAPIPGSYL
jgi:hypothetical protein